MDLSDYDIICFFIPNCFFWKFLNLIDLLILMMFWIEWLYAVKYFTEEESGGGVDEDVSD